MQQNKYIKLPKIYEEIFEAEVNSGINDEEKKCSRMRIYRAKFSILLKIFGCKKELYKSEKGNSYEVSKWDAEIIKYIISEASTETSFIGKWFNNKLNTFNSQEIVKHYEELEMDLNLLEKENKTDIVHVNDWLESINTLVDYTTAKQITEITELLELIRSSSLPISNNIKVGQVYSTDEDGRKDIILEPRETLLENETKNFSTTKQYLDLFCRNLKECNKEIDYKSYNRIKQLTELKINFGASGTAADYLDEENKEIVSEYVLRDYNIQKYLQIKPEIKSKLEQDLNINNIEKYYQIVEM